MERCYLDHATTTPLDPRVRLAMEPYLGDAFGSPQGLHRRARLAREAVERSRASVAALVGCPPADILFTSSATESNNLAIKGSVRTIGPGTRLLAAATEHISVLHPMRTLARAGCELVVLPVDRHGVLDLEAARRELLQGAALLSVAHASAEIGTIQPIDAIGRLAREAGVPFHCDAAFSTGLVHWPGDTVPAELVTLTPHLFNGPQGIAALRIAPGLRIRPIVEGGIQEGGLRGGTQPVAAIVGFGAAADIVRAERDDRALAVAGMARQLRAAIDRGLQGVIHTGHPSLRVPGHLSLCVQGVEAEALLRDLDSRGFEASSGSACTTEVGKTSQVLDAIGVDPQSARGALTFMFGGGNGAADPVNAAAALAAAVDRLRRLSPLAPPA